MKTMRKLFALVLAMTMVFALAATAGAEEATVSVTVDNAQPNTTYNVYELLKIQSVEGTSAVYETVDTWAAFWTAKVTVGETEVDISTYFATEEVDGKTIVTAKAGYDSVAAVTVAKAAKVFAEKNQISTDGTATTGATIEEAVTVTVSQDGYYLMTSTAGPLCTLANVVKGEKVTLTEKSKDLPTMDKTIENEQYKIGDKISFKLTVETEQNKNNECNYIIHDSMGEGLTLDGNSIKVSLNGTELTSGTAGHYTINESATDGCTFEIVFTENLSTEAYDVITVEYDATLNANATNTNATNEAKIDTESDEVTVKTYEFTLNKTDGTNPLSGAIFGLYADLTCTTKIDVVSVDNNTYRPAVAGETAANLTAGSVTIKGLSAGNYYLKEITPPDGYVKDGSVKAITIAEDGTIKVDGTTKTEVKVINEKGEELPETGGMGTTLFYIVGGIMVAAAVVLLVTKKRMSAAE